MIPRGKENTGSRKRTRGFAEGGWIHETSKTKFVPHALLGHETTACVPLACLLSLLTPPPAEPCLLNVWKGRRRERRKRGEGPWKDPVSRSGMALNWSTMACFQQTRNTSTSTLHSTTTSSHSDSSTADGRDLPLRIQ